MDKNPKYNIGDRITYKDRYWGNLTGTIDMIGTQKGSFVYDIILDNGSHSICKEKEIINN